jgi:hypothetical protein
MRSRDQAVAQVVRRHLQVAVPPAVEVNLEAEDHPADIDHCRLA